MKPQTKIKMLIITCVVVALSLFVLSVYQIVEIAKAKKQIQQQEKQIEQLEKELDYYNNKVPTNITLRR